MSKGPDCSDPLQHLRGREERARLFAGMYERTES